jgi:hypothetical protein
MAAMTLKAVQAKHGDALLLTAAGATVLIDGGPPGVFNRFLEPHLEALDDGGEEPPEIDLLMVSHIDSDHIAGILDMTGDMIEAQEEDARPLVRVRRAWFNSFADTIARTGLAKPSAATASAASLASAFDDLGLSGLSHEHPSLVLSSVKQGRNLRRDLKTLSIDINARFKDRLALAGNANTPWSVSDLTLTVIGPTKVELDALKKEWAKQLPKILAKEAKKAARTAAAAALDKSVFNLASIVVIAEAGGKRMLLTGDARGDMILRWLKAAGFPGGKAHFDLIKIPHHGSDRNVTTEFFKKVTADHYLVSGDGKHGNPEPEMFRMLFEARGDAPYTVHMTYAPDEIKRHKEFKADGKDVTLDQVLNAAD